MKYFLRASVFYTLLLATIVLTGASAHALQTHWEDTEGGRMRLSIDPMPAADGLIHGALEIDLDTNWKTYWIDPGSTGIPPLVDLTGSQGITLKSMKLPAPVRVDDGYSIWAGYKHSVAYALTFEQQGAAKLRANVFIGICDKICVPFQTTFSLDIPAAEDVQQTDVSALRVIQQAKGNLPGQARDDFAITSAALSEDEGSLVVSMRVPVDDKSTHRPEVFVSANGWFFGQPQEISNSQGSASVRVPVVMKPKNPALLKAPFYFVLTFGEQAVEANLPVN